MTTDDLVKVNKAYFVKSSTMAATAAIFSSLPYLDVPPINFLINKFISWLIEQIADKLELLAFFQYIDFRVDAQGRDYVEAAHEAEKLQTEESRRLADEAFKRFVHFNR